MKHKESKHNVIIGIEDQNANKQKPKENNDYEKPDPRHSKSQKPSQNSVEKPNQYKVSPDRQNNNNNKQNDRNMTNIKENEDIINISDSSNDSDSKPTLTEENKSDILWSMVNKEPVVACDGIVTELIKHAHVKNTIDKQPVVLVQDTLSRLLYKETYAKKKTFIEHDDSLAEIIKMNVKKDNKDSVQNIRENECKNVDDFEVATLKKIQQDKFENVAKIKPFHIQDSNSEITEHIRSRLIFEDEDDEDDLISFDNFNDNITNLPGADTHTEVNIGLLHQGKMLLGTRATETYTPSVHYDDLIEDKMYICKCCGLFSSNR